MLYCNLHKPGKWIFFVLKGLNLVNYFPQTAKAHYPVTKQLKKVKLFLILKRYDPEKISIIMNCSHYE